MQETIQLLDKHGLLKVIEEELDIYLEIPHVAYIEVRQDVSKAILFLNPIDKKNNKKFTTPVLMNVFGSFKALEVLMGDVEKIASEIETILKPSMPDRFLDKLSMFKTLFSLKNTRPQRSKSKKRAKCQEIVLGGGDVNLYDLPILTTWEQDGGPFITMGQVYTQSLDGKKQNLGMYRLQVYDNNRLGMHWQIHKDSNHFFHEYKKANALMPVSIAIGGDPLYIWCGQAPLPIGVFELMLYGFIRKKRAKLVQSLTNEIYVPEDVDFVIEGFVDPNKSEIEGPFGDHTGYYTLEDEYPVMDVTAITSKSRPIY
jgi:4-hydroxy-3-polyprenylbenzoate decarboxylase